MRASMRLCSVLVVLLLWWLQPPVARASCAGGTPFEEVVTTASVVFVGAVVATADGGRVARVRVESVWRGGDIPAIVEVNGVYSPPGAPPPTPPPPGVMVASSNDRFYRVGKRYLFIPRGGITSFEDSPCTSTRPYTPDLDRFAPRTVERPDSRLPTPPPFPTPTPVGAMPASQGVATGLILAGLTAVLGLLIAAVLRSLVAARR